MFHDGSSATLLPPSGLAGGAVASAVGVLARGGLVVLDGTDHPRGVSDVVVAAEHASAAVVNALAWEARGLVCLALPGATCDRLDLPLVRSRGRSRAGGVPFAISIEARTGVSTGISAEDRAATVAAAIAPGATSDDLVSPGHVFPVRADDRGVLARADHAEAAVDLVTIAGLTPAAVMCSVLDEDGAVAQGAAVAVYAARHGLPIVRAQDVVRYRRDAEAD